MIAFVFRDTHSSTLSTLRQYVSLSISAKTGVAPVSTTALAAPTNVNEGRITSSPGPTSAASNEACNAAVPFTTATACFAPTNLAKLLSNSRTRGPIPLLSVRIPLRKTSTAASISSFPRNGWLILISSRNSSDGPRFSATCALVPKRVGPKQIPEQNSHKLKLQNRKTNPARTDRIANVPQPDLLRVDLHGRKGQIVGNEPITRN